MITEYIKGDLVELYKRGESIAHGCNCFHTMGAGVAKQIADYCKWAVAIDRETVHGDENKLGTFSMATRIHGPGDNEHHCFNLYTQYYPGPHLDYPALVSCMIELNNWGKNKVFPPVIYMPRIGCGIAGGDWNIVEQCINMFTPDLRVIIVDWVGE